MATNRTCSLVSLCPSRPISAVSPVQGRFSSSQSSPSSQSPTGSSPFLSAPTPSNLSLSDFALSPRADAFSGSKENRPQQLGLQFDIRHLVLLHHFENKTLKSAKFLLGGNEEDFSDRYESMFKAAVATPYLMHQLLAFSALHLGTTVDDSSEKQRHMQTAAELQMCALTLFNSTKPELNTYNCMAMLYFSYLLSMHTLFEKIASCTELTGLIEKATEYLKLQRGVGAITSQSWHALAQGEIRGLADAIATGEQLRQEGGGRPQECQKLTNLVQLSKNELGDGPFEACRMAVENLNWVFGLRRTLGAPYHTHITFAWPVRISSAFVQLLEQRQPISLIILAHWAVLLHIDRGFWVFGNAGRRVIESVIQHVGSYWDEWLQVPRETLETEK